MRRFAILALCVVVPCLWLIPPAEAQLGVRALPPVTGPSKASEAVVLWAGGPPATPFTNCGTGGPAIWAEFDRRVQPDGTSASFTIPSGKVLLLSRLSFQLIVGGFPPNTSLLFLKSSAGPGVLLWTGVGDMKTIAAGLALEDTIELGAPVIRPGTKICLGNAGATGALAFLHGFLAKDE